MHKKHNFNGTFPVFLLWLPCAATLWLSAIWSHKYFAIMFTLTMAGTFFKTRCIIALHANLGREGCCTPLWLCRANDRGKEEKQTNILNVFFIDHLRVSCSWGKAGGVGGHRKWNKVPLVSVFFYCSPKELIKNSSGFLNRFFFVFTKTNFVIKPALDFDELRRYHTRPLQLNWGPENVHFGKTHFRDPNIDAKITIRNFF